MLPSPVPATRSAREIEALFNDCWGAQWLAYTPSGTDAQHRPVARSAPPLEAEVVG